MKKEIFKLVKPFCENTVKAVELTDLVWDLFYAIPAEDVIVVKEKFKKRKVPTGWMYSFYSDGWGEWVFVSNTACGESSSY